MNQDQLNEQLFQAVKANDIEAVKDVIEKGADLKCQGEYGWTPLHMASYWERAEIAKILINNGAPMNAQNKCGITPLRIAAGARKNMELVNLLIDHGGKL